jgi:putative lipoprotein
VSNRPLSAADLSDTAWILEEIAGHPALEAARPTVAFDPGGRLSGSTGINRFTGSFVLVGDELSFGPLATTRRVGSTEVMEQQRRLLDALSRPCRIRIEGRRLVLDHEHSASRLLPAPPQERATRPAPGSRLVVRGTVSYRERVPMPAQAALRVRLLDTSEGESRAVVLAEDVISEPRRVPIRFELSVPTGAVDPDAWLAVDAYLSSGDQILWASEGSYPVLTRGASDLVQVSLRRVRPGEGRRRG